MLVARAPLFAVVPSKVQVVVASKPTIVPKFGVAAPTTDVKFVGLLKVVTPVVDGVCKFKVIKFFSRINYGRKFFKFIARKSGIVFPSDSIN